MNRFFKQRSFAFHQNFLTNKKQLRLTGSSFKNYRILLEQINQAEISNNVSGSYLIVESNTKHKRLIDDLTSFFEDNAKEDMPLFFIIHEIEDRQQKSDIDDFFEEYAGGDLFIPYYEEKRREKFAKIYEECSEDIKRYRHLYNKKL